MKNLITTSIIIASMVFSTSQVLAERGQEGKRKGPPAFSSIDLDGNGIVTMEEFSEQELRHIDHQTLFNHIDTDQDGVITEAEFKDHKPPRKERQPRQ